MFLKLILFLEDLDELSRSELINVTFCYQSLLPGHHFLPKEASTKYQGIFSFATILGKMKRQIYYEITLRFFYGKFAG